MSNYSEPLSSFRLYEHNKQLATALGKACLKYNQILTTAESCTGGGIAQAITAISGSSAWFDCSFVTYSNESKQHMLHVDQQTLTDCGAVSIDVVEQMARQSLIHSNATLSVAVSGIAGPHGGTTEKPVGTICFAWAARNKIDNINEKPANELNYLYSEQKRFNGDRQQIQFQAIQHALNGLIEKINHLF